MADKPVPYTQSGCAESARIRTWLVEHGVRFAERDVGADPEVARDLYATGVFATPLLVVGTDKVLGFRRRALTSLVLDRSNRAT